ncbi:MAG: hypothetical protein ACLTMO_08465, partial [Faecalibacterium prausnitzii]
STMRKTDAFRRAAALMAALSITVSLAAPAFAGTYYINYGDIIITKKDDGSQEIKQNGTIIENDDRGEIIITTVAAAATTQESDLEGPAAEDSGFGPVVEDNYQPAQPEDAEQPKDADQPEDAEEPEGTDQPESTEEPKAADRQESAGQQAQPQQAAPAAAPAASTPQNDKGNGFWGNTITVINKAATALKLTLKDVKIDVSDTGNPLDDDDKGNAALSVQGEGDVEIELDGKNELKSGAHRAGLEKTSKGTLTLKDDKKDDNKKAGSLKATGGKYGAGIGGGRYHDGEYITITGGRVNATGGEEGGAGIGGGYDGNSKNITITGGTVNATGGENGAGIGGGAEGSGEDITITGGRVNATGGKNGAGIGGGINGSGINVTVSGAAQVTATASKSDDWDSADTGATIGNGGSVEDGDLVNGEEIQADISGLTTGYIHHIICDENGNKVKEWWEPERPQPNPEGPNAPAEESNGVSLGTPVLHVETLEGDPLPFNAQQQGSTLRVTTDNLAARLHGNREALEALREQGVEQIEFVTSLKTTTLSVAELLAEGGSWFALEHDGLVSRRLSAAQAESLKCWMH